MAKGGARAHAGRKRKPTDLKVLQGTFRPDRHKDEPIVTQKWPEPPAFVPLSDRQRVIWAGLKDGDGWHAGTDWPSVWGLVKAVDGLIANHQAQLETDTASHPLSFKHTIQEQNGKSVEIVTAEENPLRTGELKFLDRLYKYIAINGRSPVDRAKMPSAGKVKPENPLDRFIKKTRG